MAKAINSFNKNISHITSVNLLSDILLNSNAANYIMVRPQAQEALMIIGQKNALHYMTTFYFKEKFSKN